MISRRAAALAGMIGPAFFVTVFTLEGWLRPGYDPLRMYVSELSLGARGWIQILNFMGFGVLMLIFTRGIAGEFRTGSASKAGPALLAVIALCYLLSGPFVMDPVNIPPDRMTWHGILHGIFGAFVFTLMPVVCFVYLPRFHTDPAWRALHPWTLAAGVTSAAAVVLLTLSTRLPIPQEVITAGVGALQRGAILPFQAWLFLFALCWHRSLRPAG